MDVPRTPSWQIKLRGVIGSLGAQERRFAEYLLNSFAGIEKEPIAVLAKEPGNFFRNLMLVWKQRRIPPITAAT